MKNKSSFMEELSMDELINRYNFFIPEIQREYVWGNNERNILDTFCNDLKESKKESLSKEEFESQVKKLMDDGLSVLDAFNQVTDQVKRSQLNIGFLYSYKPDYRMEHIPDNEAYKDVYLIDGQQRFTTLFLIALYLSIKEEGKQKDFLSTFRFNAEISTVALDYRVRNLTHCFVIDLINHSHSLDQLINCEQETWCIKSYKSDPTVNSMIKALKIIDNHFRDEIDLYYNYIIANICFWHFKTEKTDQGEELYITMNSRGKPLEDNEELRTLLFSGLSKQDELYYSEKWEIWQDFFWKNRYNKKDNADKAFNEFLRLVASYISYLNGSKDFISINKNIEVAKLRKNLSLGIIDKYFNQILYLLNNLKSFESYYTYSSWLIDCHKYLYELIFIEKTNWFVDYSDSSRANEQRKMVFIWSTLFFMDNRENDDNLELIRFLRLFWVRYNNYDRSVSSIKDRVLTIIHEGVFSINECTTDEISKHSFYQKISDQSYLFEIESAIWRIEDLPLNLNGYQVGLKNITHLVNFDTDEITLAFLNNIYEKFSSLFRSSQDHNNLATLLLYYGDYSRRVSPYYYANLDYSNWRRIIRDLDNEKEKPFYKFFLEYDGTNLISLLNRKRLEYAVYLKELLNKKYDYLPFTNSHDCVKLFAFIIDNIWINGRYIASLDQESEIYLTEYEKQQKLYNTSGSFRGYYNTTLYELTKANSSTELLNILQKRIESFNVIMTS